MNKQNTHLNIILTIWKQEKLLKWKFGEKFIAVVDSWFFFKKKYDFITCNEYIWNLIQIKFL